jgi:hypothetical protein
VLAQPKIRAYYDQVLADFSGNDMTHMLHYLLKMLENMKRLDGERGRADHERVAAAAPVGPTDSRRR